MNNRYEGKYQTVLDLRRKIKKTKSAKNSADFTVKNQKTNAIKEADKRKKDLLEEENKLKENYLNSMTVLPAISGSDITLYYDRVIQKYHDEVIFSADTSARVEESGSISYVPITKSNIEIKSTPGQSRSTATRVALGAAAGGVPGAILGGMSKKEVQQAKNTTEITTSTDVETYDNRKLYLIVEGSDMPTVFSCNPSNSKEIHECAATINYIVKSGKYITETEKCEKQYRLDYAQLDAKIEDAIREVEYFKSAESDYDSAFADSRNKLFAAQSDYEETCQQLDSLMQGATRSERNYFKQRDKQRKIRHTIITLLVLACCVLAIILISTAINKQDNNHPTSQNVSSQQTIQESKTSDANTNAEPAETNTPIVETEAPGTIHIASNEIGEYGQEVTIDGITSIEFFVPTGSYTAQNEGDHTCVLFVASDETVTNSEGFQENTISSNIVFSAGDTQTIIVEEGTHIILSDQAKMVLIPD